MNLSYTSKKWWIWLPLLPLTLFFIISLNYYFSDWLIPGFTPYDTKRVLQLVLLGIIAFYLLLNSSTALRALDIFYHLPKIARYGLTFILIIGLISSCLAPLPKMAILEVSLSVLLFCFTLFLAGHRMAYQKEVDFLLLAIITLSIIDYIFIYFKTYIYYTFHPILASSIPSSSFPNFVNIRFFSQYLAWTLFLAPLPILFVRRIPVKIFFYLIACLWWTIAFASATKSIWLAAACSVVFFYFILRGSIKSFLWLNIKVIIGSCLIYFILFHLSDLANLLHIHSNDSSGGNNQVLVKAYTPLHNSSLLRLDLWKHALSLLWQHPLLGIGPMHFAYYVNTIAAHPHNSLLQIAVEWGILAAIVALILFLLAIFSWSKWLITIREKNTLSPLIIAISLSFLTGMLNSLVDGVIVTPLSQVMLCVIIAWMLGIYQVNQSSHIAPSKIGILLFSLIITVSLIGVFGGIYPQILTLTQSEIIWFYNQTPDNAIFMPRFWLQGWIY